jgi:hypothetical protein
LEALIWDFVSVVVEVEVVDLGNGALPFLESDDLRDGSNGRLTVSPEEGVRTRDEGFRCSGMSSLGRSVIFKKGFEVREAEARLLLGVRDPLVGSDLILGGLVLLTDEILSKERGSEKGMSWSSSPSSSSWSPSHKLAASSFNFESRTSTSSSSSSSSISLSSSLESTSSD